jgi:hypothetical protein
MQVRHFLPLFLIVAFVVAPQPTAVAQDAPLPARSPEEVRVESPASERTDIGETQSDAPPAERWTDESFILQAPANRTAAQLSAPIPIPDAYATTEGVVLDVPAPGLIANDYHPDGSSFILSQFFSPEHGTLPSIVTNGAFRYVPAEGFVGTDTFRYRLMDADGNFSEFITVTVEVYPDPNRPPIPVSDEFATLMNTELNIAAPGLIHNDVDPDGDSFILSQFFSPEHGTLPSIVTNGAFRYVPPADFTGTDSFRYRLMDEHGAFSDFIDVVVHVVPPGGDSPIAIPDHYVTTKGTTLSIPAPGLIANDIDPDGDSFILSQFFSPEHGTLPSIVTNGAFTYVPPADFVGTDSFRYRLMNGKGNFSEFVTVTITVLPEFNRPPVPVADFYGTPANTDLNVPAPGLIVNDFDPDGDSFILSQFFSPEHGTLPSIVTNGAFRYVPPADFTGVDTFRYRLMDEHGAFSEFIDVTVFVGIDPSDPCAIDTTPPTLAVHSTPTILSPPNRQLRTLSLASLDIEVTDECDTSLSRNDVVIVAVSSDEPASKPVGPFAAGDIFIGETCSAVQLRADRQGGGNGRVYTLHLEVMDASGNLASAEHQVHVPPNNRPGAVAVADETVYTVVAEGCYEQSGATAFANRGGEWDVESDELPTSFRLGQNYPNPFNPSTSVQLDLPIDVHVRLQIYDMLGREVTSLVDSPMSAGQHTFNWHAEDHPSGTYFLRVEAGLFKETRAMVLVK